MKTKRKLVHCIAIDYNYIYTLCCSNNCPHHIHKYGSANDLSNRMEYRCSHCPYDKREVKIRIDETSKRCKLNYYKNKSITLSVRALKNQRLTIQKKNTQEKNIWGQQAGNEPFTVTFD
jgi:hypothetical protein